MFTIKRATYTIKGDNFKCIFVRILILFFLLRLFDHYQAVNSRALAPTCGALVLFLYVIVYCCKSMMLRHWNSFNNISGGHPHITLEGVCSPLCKTSVCCLVACFISFVKIGCSWSYH